MNGLSGSTLMLDAVALIALFTFLAWSVYILPTPPGGWRAWWQRRPKWKDQ